MTCSSRPISPSSVRLEGYTELLGDLSIICTGGTPTAAGTPVATGDVTVTLSVPVTNRKNSTDSFIDALLLVDEPHSVANPNVPLTLCGASGVDCNITGTGTGAGVYSGASNRPNVFQGELIGTNTVRFNMPVDAPGVGNQRIFRILNLRGDASGMTGRLPNTITASVSLPGNLSVPATILGIVHPGLSLVPQADRGNARLPVQLAGCTTSNTGWAANQEGDILPVRERNYAISVQEGSPGAWRPRNIAQTIAAGRYGGPVASSLGNLNQNVTGYMYATESGFFNGASTDPGFPAPSIPATTTFPAVRGADRAGAADFGTRIFVRFTNVPQGVQLFLPVETPLLSNSARSGSAVMVQSDSQGGMQRVTGGARYGLAAMSQSGGTATAFYEVVSSDPLLIENLSIPIVIVNPGVSGSTAAMRLSAGIVPALGPASADASAVIPRFSGASVSEDALAWGGGNCDAIDLTTSIGYTPSTNTIQVQVENIGLRTSSGLVTVSIALPSGLTATSWSGPSGWTCSLGSLACTSSQQISPASGGAIFNLQFTTGNGVPDQVVISSTVSGGGDGYSGNNTTNTAITLNSASVKGVTVETSPSGLLHSIDGVYYQGRRTFTGKVGQIFQLSAVPTQSLRDGNRVTLNGNQSISFPVPQITGYQVDPQVFAFDTPPSVMVCKAPGSSTNFVIRKEGLSELLNIGISCTGGTPTAIGQPVPRSDIRVKLNAPITSRIVNGAFTEALLVIDFPHTSVKPNIPLLPCGAAGSNEGAAGECSSNGAGAADYDGGNARPNVFQGKFENLNTILFKNVPIDAPGTGVQRQLQFFNIRVNAASMPLSGQSGAATTVSSNITFTGGISVADDNVESNHPVAIAPKAFAEPDVYGGTNYRVTTPLTLSRCLSANPQIYQDASKPLDTGTQNGAQTSVRFFEITPGVLKAKSWSVRTSNMSSDPTIVYAADVRQDIPDAAWNTETGFFAGSNLLPTFYPSFTTGSNIPLPSPPFPSTHSLDAAGRADAGVRMFFKFTGIPADVKLFVPVQLGPTAYVSPAPKAVLITTDANGAGAFVQTAGNASGYAPLAIVGGQATAFYEIVGEAQNLQEFVDVPVAIAFPANTSGGTGTIRVQLGFGPMSNVGNADSTSPIPRFAIPETLANTLTFAEITSCGFTIDKYSLAFQTVVGQDPAQQTIAVSNPANPAFTWTVSKNVSWIGVSPTSGAGSGTIAVRPSAAGLPAGTYDGSVSISSPGLSTQSVAVRMVVGNGTPSGGGFTGSVDLKSCDAISGWAADTTRLNQSITVSLYAGSTLVTSTLASGSRPDVGTFLGDNGLHGFTFSVPSGLRDGVQRSYSVRFENNTNIGLAFNLTCGTTTPPPPTTRFTGFFESATCTAATGWAADLNRLNTAISVDLLEGSTVLATVLANGNRPDVGAYIGDNGLHGFSIPIPDALKNGVAHTLSMRYTGSTTALGSSPKTITCGSTPPTQARYTGFFDYAGCDAARGWAADLNRLNTAVSVDLLEGTSVLATVLANVSRPDVGSYLGDNGLHGFDIPIPDSLKNGAARSISMRFTGTTQALGSSPRTIQCTTTNPPPAAPVNPTGFVDYAGCDATRGWAADLGRLNQAISVDLVEGTSILATVLANASRPDVGAYIGDNGLHGFEIPIPNALKNGASHTILLRYTGTTKSLNNSPKTIQCSSSGPTRPTGFVDYAGCDVISGWAADLNQLNQSISVDIVEGTTILTTVLANASRGDVGAYIGDNGLHGFTVPTPTSLKNGTSRTIQVRYNGTTQSLGNSPRTLQCAAQ